jgi:hypothetical protein
MHAYSIRRVFRKFWRYGDCRRGLLTLFSFTLCTFILSAFTSDQIAHAGDLNAMASQMSDHAFALLDTLNKQNSGGSTNPLLPQVATFAGDAQTLSSALGKGDMSAANNSVGILQSDSANTDAAIAAHPGAVDTTQWKALKQQLNEITHQLQLAGGAKPAAATPTNPSAPLSTSSSPPSSAASSAVPVSPPGAAASAGPAPAADGSAPKIVVESRIREGVNVVRLKGYYQGTALQSSGIYENGQQLKGFKVADVPGDQRVNFDIGLEAPTPDTVIRVTDAKGRFAEAPVLDLTAGSAEGWAPSATAAGPPPGPIASTGGTTDESGVEVFRGSNPEGDDTAPSDSTGGAANTAEIPSHGTPRKSPSKRHTLSSHLGNVQINILGLTELQSVPPTYDVVGQISGRGVTHAGIYVDGRMVKKIPIEDGSDFTSFDQQFPMNGGQPTIRAYGVGSQFVESSIDLSSGSGVAALSPGMVPGSVSGMEMAPQGLAIQITGVRPFANNVYVVTGVISGRDLSSAGLYQNGMLVQNIGVGAGGILGGILGSFTSGGYRNTNFTVQYNANMGPATVRAFDRSGAYTEQPVMAGGGSPFGSPYAGMNSYGTNPYATNPYATNPYAAPMSPYGAGANPYYGTTPYSTNPFSTNPFSNPYGARPAVPSRPLW